jgi:uncharacterized protein YneR
MTDVTVANAILDQLGGYRFVRMTGAKNMLAYPTGLKFSIPARMARHRINGMSVMLNGDDLYYVEFLKINMKKQIHTVVFAYSGIYGDQLRELFERKTGLRTSLF